MWDLTRTEFYAVLAYMNQTYITPECLEHRRVYELRARNLRFGAWNGDDGTFYGIREKFGSLFIDNELLWNDVEGTARAVRALDILVPEPIPLQARLGLVCEYCDKPSEGVYVEDEEFKAKNLNGGMKVVQHRHVNFADSLACINGDKGYFSVWKSNKDLYDFMEKVEGLEGSCEDEGQM